MYFNNWRLIKKNLNSRDPVAGLQEHRREKLICSEEDVSA